MTPKQRALKKFIAYYRVSTKKQGRSGLGLDAQREAAAAHLSSVQGKLVGEFTEIEHGTRRGNRRPQLAAALIACRVHGATLIIAKLDRLARNVAFTSNLMESGVEFTAVDFPQANRLTIHILAAIAEHEAEMISTRTKAALAAAKRKGVVLGGYRGKHTHAQMMAANRVSVQVRSEAARQRAMDLMSVIQELRASGAVSLSQIAEGLNSKGISTARGSEWSRAQVYRVLIAAGHKQSS